MSVLCGWASIDERGKSKNGAAGNQTGKELKVANWYQFGQTVCLRWKDRNLAKEYAKVIKSLCQNKHIGYDQNQRETLHYALKALSWDYTKLAKNCETDCSALVATAICCVFKKQVVSPSIYTGNLVAALMNTGYFEKFTGSKYCSSSDYLLTGDILNKPGHVISVLEDGPKAGQKVSDSKVAEPTLKKGSKGAEVKKLQSNLNELGFTDGDGKKLECDGSFGNKTKFALIAMQKKYGLEPDGIYGNKSYAKLRELIK